MDAPYYNGPDERDPGCSEDFDTCECPACREWRDNNERIDEQQRADDRLAFEREQMADWQRLKR